VIIDSLIGTGFKGVLRGMPLKAAILINRSKSPVVSVDVPSGLSSDGEVPEGEVVKADYTITMGLPKISLVTYPGKEYCGELIIADIGFPPSLTDNEDIKIELLDVEYMKATDISAESDDIHKTDKGNTLIVGGLAGMEGAAILTAAAMFKTGTGLVTIATTETSRQIIAGKVPELMTTSLPEKPDKESVADLLKTKKYTALIIGPGLGRDAYAESVFSFVIDSVAECGIRKIIIDGDGLYHLVSYIKEKKLAAGISWIITPHFMEASRISGVSIEKLKNNRFQSCKMISEDTGCITVLKVLHLLFLTGEKPM
jgi:NAD(P)H-hydrate epimerase